jgi:hypothetical protein
MSSDSLHDVGVSLIDDNKAELGLRLNFTGGNMCNETHKFSLIVQLNCEEYAPKSSYEIDAASIQTPCSPRVILSSKDACPILSLHSLWHFFD